MPLSTTPDGDLAPIVGCRLNIPNAGEIVMNNLPELSDSKNAVYNNQAIIGRSFPLYTYHFSGDRNINLGIHFFVRKTSDTETNLMHLKWIQSAAYPRDPENGGAESTPFLPPPICTIQCGQLLGDQPLCVILQTYHVTFPTDVAWDSANYCPYKFKVDTTWLVVYTSCDLPNQDRIMRSGR